MAHAIHETLTAHADVVNIPGYTEQFIAQHEAIAMEKSVRILDGVSPDAIVIGDAPVIHGMIERLLTDALDFTPSGGCLSVRSHIMQGHVVLCASCIAAGQMVNNPALELTISLPIVAG
jgi:two-component system, OmpR family, sensor histidine kinase CreC